MIFWLKKLQYSLTVWWITFKLVYLIKSFWSIWMTSSCPPSTGKTTSARRFKLWRSSATLDLKITAESTNFTYWNIRNHANFPEFNKQYLGWFTWKIRVGLFRQNHQHHLLQVMEKLCNLGVKVNWRKKKFGLQSFLEHAF